MSNYPWLNIEQYVLEGLNHDVQWGAGVSDEEIAEGINGVINDIQRDDQTTDDDLPYEREEIIAEAIRLSRES